MERDGRVKDFITRPGFILTGKIIISLALLWGLSLYLDDEAILRSFRNANLLYLMLGLILAAVQLMISVYRWKYLLNLVSQEIPNREIFASFFISAAAGFFTPVQVGEFAGRIASHPNVKKSHIVGMTLIDRLYRMALTLIIGGYGLIFYMAAYLPEYWNSAVEYPAIILLAILAAFVLVPEKIKVLLPMLPKRVRTHRLYQIIAIIDSEFHNTNARILFLLTLFLYLSILMEHYLLSLAFGNVALFSVVLCVSSVIFIKSTVFPISFGDLGIRESASVFFYEKAGMTAAVGFNSSIIVSFVNVIIPAAIGALLVVQLHRKTA